MVDPKAVHLAQVKEGAGRSGRHLKVPRRKTGTFPLTNHRKICEGSFCAIRHALVGRAATFFCFFAQVVFVGPLPPCLSHKFYYDVARNANNAEVSCRHKLRKISWHRLVQYQSQSHPAVFRGPATNVVNQTSEAAKRTEHGSKPETAAYPTHALFANKTDMFYSQVSLRLRSAARVWSPPRCSARGRRSCSYGWYLELGLA